MKLLISYIYVQQKEKDFLKGANLIRLQYSSKWTPPIYVYIYI